MYLERIVAVKRREVAELREEGAARKFERQIAALPPALGFERALRNRKRPHMGLIAEVKKASPSKGLIRENFEPVKLAREYEEAGADCISVLTDREFFQGSNEYLRQIREAVPVPILRKDFTIDELQIYEARAIGADAVLLIAAILSADQMKRFLREARGLGLDALVEVHDEKELELALELDAAMIGINNRNLHTFVTDLAVTEGLIPRIPKEKLKISESGISKREDVEALAAAGADAVLIGETFMRRPSPAEAVHELMGERAPAGGEALA